jgi:hypothetical protein
MEQKSKYLELAELIRDILCENIYPELNMGFSMPHEAIIKTAASLEQCNRTQYYAGIIDDFGGYMDREIEKYLSTQITIK